MIGVLLAGGQGKRLGGCDKASLPIPGGILWQVTGARLRPQVDRLVINHNSPHRLRPSPPPLVTVLRDACGVGGPLAGILTALMRWPDELIVTVAVDLPRLPLDLVTRLGQARREGGCAYATVDGRHALAVLWSPGMGERLHAVIAREGVRVSVALQALGVPVECLPDARGDLRINLNTHDDLAFDRPVANAPETMTGI